MVRVANAALLIAAATIGACASMPPPPPAVLNFAASECARTPDLTSALSLTPDKERALHAVTTQVGSATPCIYRDGAETPYILYALPVDLEDKTLTVGGYLEPLRILSPKIEVLDATGQTSRRFPGDEYLYRGFNYSILFRPRAEEHFILVTIDPSRVGQRYDSIVIGVSTSATGAPVAGLASALVGSGNITTGTDVSLSRTFSYEGAVQVVVNDSDTEEAAADGN